MTRHETKLFRRLPVLTAALALLVGAAALPASAQTVEELVAKNLEARGGADEIRAVKSLRMSGSTQIGQDQTAQMTIEWERPNKVRTQTTVGGQDMIQAYDGETAWGVAPMAGVTAPVELPAEQQEALSTMGQEMFEGSLLGYAERGTEVEYVGREEVDGKSAYKLQVTRPDGTAAFLFLDPETMLEIRSEVSQTVQGEEMTFTSDVSDYREVGGLMFPFTIEQRVEGGPMGGGSHSSSRSRHAASPTVSTLVSSSANSAPTRSMRRPISSASRS